MSTPIHFMSEDLILLNFSNFLLNFTNFFSDVNISYSFPTEDTMFCSSAINLVISDLMSIKPTSTLTTQIKVSLTTT